MKNNQITLLSNQYDGLLDQQLFTCAAFALSIVVTKLFNNQEL